MRLGWPHNWSRHFTEEKKCLKLLIQTMDHRAHGPFTTWTMLSRHPILHIYKYWHCGIASLWYRVVWKVGTNALEQHTVSMFKAGGGVFLCNLGNHVAHSKYHNPEDHNTIAITVRALDLIHIDGHTAPPTQDKQRTSVWDMHTGFKLDEQ